MKRCAIGLVCWCWVAVATAWGQALQFGMTPEQVLEELGRPRSTMSAGGRDIWMYDAGGRVVFAAGKVSSIEQLPVDGVNGATTRSVVMRQTKAAEAEAAAIAAAQAAEAEALRLEEEEAARQQREMEAAWAEERKQFEEETEAFLNGERAGEEEYALSVWQRLAYLGVEMLVGMAVMVLILKGAFAWADIHGDWGQMVLPAFAAVAVKGGVQFAAEVVWDVPEVFYVDQGLSYLALMLALMKFTHASSWKRAVAVAGAAKLASIVVWTLLSVVLLNLMFG